VFGLKPFVREQPKIEDRGIHFSHEAVEEESGHSHEQAVVDDVFEYRKSLSGILDILFHQNILIHKSPEQVAASKLSPTIFNLRLADCFPALRKVDEVVVMQRVCSVKSPFHLFVLIFFG